MSFAILQAFNNVIFAGGAVFFIGIATGVIEVKNYDTPEKVELHYKELQEQQGENYQGRCRDRWEDFAQVLFEPATDSGLKHALPAFRMLFACHQSKIGKEPAEKYYSLARSSKYYIDPSWRRPLEELLREKL